MAEPRPGSRRTRQPRLSTLRVRIMLGFAAYSLVLATAILLHGNIGNERIEEVMWHSMLEPEAQRLLSLDPREALEHTGNATYRVYFTDARGQGNPQLPAAFRDLGDGLHDEIAEGTREFAVLIRSTSTRRVYLSVDITELELREYSMTGWLLASTLAGMAFLALLIGWLSGRLLRPVTQLAAAMDQLDPEHRGARIPQSGRDVQEVNRIATATNRFLDRMDGFVARERTFMDTASHELRTPIAVIGGAASVALSDTGLSDAARKALQRIQHSATEVERLVKILLVLAKSPQRLRENFESCELHEVLPGLISDHQYLMVEKDLHIEVVQLSPCQVRAPAGLVQAAISNLLRNAIENSDRGVIRVALSATGQVCIRDPGHGMNPEEISRLYVMLARRGDSHGQGIGLELIHRICEHLGWQLTVHAASDGTEFTLDVGNCRVPG